METLIRLSSAVLPVLYALAAVAYAADFFLRGDARAARAARVLMDNALGLHACYLALRTALYGHVPLASTAEVLTTVAFAVALVHVLVERRSQVQGTGLFVVSLVLMLQTLSSAFISSTPVFPALLRSPLFALHTISAALGYAAFVVSAVYGLLFLVLYHELRGSRFGLVYDRLPPLQALATMSVRAAAFGVALLSVTIACGSLWAGSQFPGFVRDPKFLFTVGVWLVYAVALAAYDRFRWTGRRTIVLSLAGFVLLVAALVVSRLFLETFHVFA